jgi:acetyltransferase-like isoleucine patch superfamily enzyme
MIRKIRYILNILLYSPEQYARNQGVIIGNNCNIQTRDFGSEPYLVEIGDNVQITNGTKIFTHGSGWVFRDEFPKFDTFGKVKIGNNVYIGNNSLIMPGVTIPSNTIVAAGSVVTKSYKEEGCIIGGNPARIIGNLQSLKNKLIPYNLNSKGLSYQKKKELLLELSQDKFINK